MRIYRALNKPIKQIRQETMKNITDQERQIFEVITNASNLCLVKGTLRGEEVSLVSLIQDKEDDVDVYPLAILVTDEIRVELKPDEENFT